MQDIHAENYTTLKKKERDKERKRERERGRKERWKEGKKKKDRKGGRGRERKKDLNKWRDIVCSWIGILNLEKMSILPKLMYRFNKISIKIPPICFAKTKLV